MKRTTFLLALFATTALFPLTAAKSPDDSIRAYLDQAVETGEIPGAVVVIQQHGKVVFEAAVGWAVIEEKRPMRLDDIFMMASSTKPFSATTVMTLVDQGKLSLDDPVSKYYPEFKGRSTLRQLLSHTSGMFGNGATAEEVEPIRNFDRELRAAIPLILKTPLAYEPGAEYSYGGASFSVAGGIVEKLTGMEFDAYMKKVLLDPLGLTDSLFRTSRDISSRVPRIYSKVENGSFEPQKAVMELPGKRGPRPDGFILVPGGLYSTARDAVRFLQMHLNGGEDDSRRILSRPAAEEMRKKQTGSQVEQEYGLGWQRTKVSDDGRALQIGHGGAYGTQLWVDTERDLVAAVLTQTVSGQSRRFHEEVKRRIETTF